MVLEGVEMKSKLYCKILALSVILLSIGVSFSSAISVDTHSIIENEEECKECKDANSVFCDIVVLLYNIADEMFVYYDNLSGKQPTLFLVIIYGSIAAIWAGIAVTFLSLSIKFDCGIPY